MTTKHEPDHDPSRFRQLPRTDRDPPLVLTLLRDLEAPIVYAMTFVSVAIGLLVWGATKVGRGNEGLFHQFREVFGTEYGVAFLLVMLGLFLLNRRWAALGIIAMVWILMGFLEWNPYREEEPSLDEYFALGAMLSSVVIAACVHYGVWED